MTHVELNRGALKGRVAVLMGGASAEREISLETGRAVYEALRRRLPEIALIDVGPQVVRDLLDQSVRHVFIALHGAGGEDGTMQGALETMGISYTGSGVLACALAMDKVRCKRFWQAEGIATPDFRVVDADSRFEDLAASLGPQLIVKPATEGSSIGITPVDDAAALKAAVALAARYGTAVLAERRVIGPEYTVGIVDGEVLPSIRLETPNPFYDYQAKYQSEATRYHCPSGLSDAGERELATLASRAFDSLGCRGWGRVDIMRDASSGAFQVLEVNTSPGMTSHSLVPMAARAAGLDFENLVVRILNASLVANAGGRGLP